jgi:hypothetical protein
MACLIRKHLRTLGLLILLMSTAAAGAEATLHPVDYLTLQAVCCALNPVALTRRTKPTPHTTPSTPDSSMAGGGTSSP